MNASKKRIAVLVSNDLSTDQRVHKVCMFLKERGYLVHLYGRELPDSLPLDRPYSTKRFKLWFKKGPLFYAHLNWKFFFYLLRNRHDWVLSNDLDTLLSAYLVSKLRATQLVYDTHEYYCGVPELQARPRVQAVWRKIEGFIFPRLKKVYTVNDSIANLYQKEYGLRPLVLRNISPKLELTQIPQSSWPVSVENRTVLVLQGAGINVQRGAEEAVLSMKHFDDVILFIIGSGDVLPVLKQIVETEKLQDKVFFLGKMPYQQMMTYTSQAHIGLSLDKGDSVNYQLSLPNKVFDYIQARVPLIVSPVVEVQNLVRKHGVGLVLDTVTVEALVEAIAKLKGESDLWLKLKHNTEIAAQELTWENEVQILKEIYP